MLQNIFIKGKLNMDRLRKSKVNKDDSNSLAYTDCCISAGRGK